MGKVSATSSPLTDIRAPLSPLWWILVPPSVEALRGLFWVGYSDAASWFAAPPADPLEICGKCRCGRAAADEMVPDPLSSSRLTKYNMAQKLLLRKTRPLENALPETDPATGKTPTELIAAYRKSVDQNVRVMLWMCLCVSMVIFAWMC